MKRIFMIPFVLGLVLLASGCSYFKIVRGDGDLVNEEIKIEEYDRIMLAGPSMSVIYQQSDEGPALQIKTDRNIYEMFEFKVIDNELRIYRKEEYEHYSPFPTEFTVTTRSEKLRYIGLTGKNDFQVKDTLRIENLELTLTGNSHFKADYLLGSTVDGSITGAGTLDLAGKVNKASLLITGNGEVNAFEMETAMLNCVVTGRGNLNVWATAQLDAVITGMGKVRYKGDPEVSKQVNGIGSVKKAN